MTMANNRVDPSVNFTAIAEALEGFTGSDIKEVCREAVVRIAHEKAQVRRRGGCDHGCVCGSGGSGVWWRRTHGCHVWCLTLPTPPPHPLHSPTA